MVDVGDKSITARTAIAASTAQPSRPSAHGAAESPSRESPFNAGTTMSRANTTSTTTPRKTQCQLSSSVTNPATVGPINDGTTHAAAKAAKIAGSRSLG